MVALFCTTKPCVLLAAAQLDRTVPSPKLKPRIPLKLDEQLVTTQWFIPLIPSLAFPLATQSAITESLPTLIPAGAKVLSFW